MRCGSSGVSPLGTLGLRWRIVLVALTGSRSIVQRLAASFGQTWPASIRDDGWTLKVHLEPRQQAVEMAFP